MDAQTLIAALKAQDEARPRSRQTAIGVSSLGSCRRKVWLELQGTPKTNPTSSLAAVMGTAIHAAIETAFAGRDGILLETRVEIDGYPPATIDYYDSNTGEIVDWKTTKVSGLGYFPSQQQRWQVQTYGYLMTLAGYDVKHVTLVAIARDGDEDDITVHTEPYAPEIAETAFAWLREIENATEAPYPEKDAASFCRKYCGFYGSACDGITKTATGAALTDADAARAAHEYLRINQQIAALETQKEAAREALIGHSGVTAEGVKVTWSESAGRATIDTEQVKAILGDLLPMKTGRPTTRLTVTQ